MTYTPVTSFRRALCAADLKGSDNATPAPLSLSISKWDVLKELAIAREAFALSDRDLTVLQAMLSFHKGSALDLTTDQLVIFPSNKKICERLNGMPCSTMRRHLSKLITAGLIVRRDSPNGKRYVRTRGAERVAYGFDIAPLVHRFVEICEAAEETRKLEAAKKALREDISLMRRDLAGLLDLGSIEAPDLGLWPALSDFMLLSARTLRRKLTVSELIALKAELEAKLEHAKSTCSTLFETEEMSINDGQIEQHQYTTNLEKSESKHSNNQDHITETQTHLSNTHDGFAKNEETLNSTPPPFINVQQICSELQEFVEYPIQSWEDLEIAADTVRPMMGISSEVWFFAKDCMGHGEAAIALAKMLQDFSKYKSPGAYLRTLATRASEGVFSLEKFVNMQSKLAA